jgi:Abnormal spindle-like microcephaly-assoc'd, ASPM-SPD-2-Hydin
LVYRTILRLLPTVLLAAFTQSGCVSSSGNLAGPPNLSFGNVAIGSSSNQNLTLMNSSTSAITVTQAVASGSGFTVKGPSLPLTLAEGQSVTFTTRFAPTAIGSASGSLSITKSQTITTTPQLGGGSGSVATSISTNLETIALVGAGVPVAPSISTQPASQTLAAGQAATFLVAASGSAPLSYQWQKNGAAISGATSSTYITPAAATSDTGSQFTVVVSNSAGNVTSNAATLTVTAATMAPSITTQPASQTVTSGQTATFSVAAVGTAPLSYQWSKNGTVISGAASTTYTTPVTTSADTGSQFTVAISNSAGNATSNAATLTVSSTPVAITVTPGSATLAAGNTQQFAGNVTGTSNTGVTWSVSGSGCGGAACGTISSSGIFVAPASVPSPAVVNVKATSVADPTKSASASVTIVAAVVVLLSVSPASASVPTVGTQLFTASVTGTSNTAVTWGLSGTGCSGSSCGTISTSGSSAVYSAPIVAPAPATVTVTATSSADPTKSASSSVTVVPVVAVTVSPASASVTAGATQQFSASVTGTLNTAVGWSVTGTGCNGAACGTVSSNGFYTAPATAPSPAIVAVTAISVADPRRSSAANVTVVPSAKAGAGPVLPTLPQANVDVTMPVQTGTVRNVAAGSASGFQSAINTATCGDTIVLVAGSTYTGNFTIPSKSCSGWILIESSAVASLPPSGTRVSGACSPGVSPATVCLPPSTANMATIVSGMADNPTIKFQTAAHNWRLIGLEITEAPGLHNYGLIETDNGATTASNLVSYLIIDRCYIHGTASGAVRRGVSFQVATGAVVDSDIREIHDQTTAPGQGSDSQAIGVWTSPGPLLIRNNFLSAASENVMFGGSTPSISNMVPSDITIVGNHFWKDYAAWHGNGFDVKNLLEFKNAQRVLIQGNVLEYSWGDAQVGFALLFTVRGENGTCTWCTVQDMTTTYNLIQHAASGIETTGADDSSMSLPDSRILIQNNVLMDINGTTWNGDGRGILSLTSGGLANLPANNITVDHNSIFASTVVLYLGDSGKIPTYQFTNNMAAYGLYGIIGGGTGTGSAALSTYITSVVYNDIVMLTASGSSDGNAWPSGTFWNSSSGAGFANYAGGDYQLTGGNYRNAGTDGKDIGVWDWTTFNTDMTNALNGK